MPTPNAPSSTQPNTPAPTAGAPEMDLRSEAERLRDHKLALLAKVKTLRENTNMRRGQITNPKPGKVYVWVNINENRQIEFQGMGYELCKDPDIKTRWRQSNGTHQRGDLILYQIDKDLHEAIKIDDELRSLDGIEAPKAAFHQQIGRLGGVPYEPAPRTS